MDSEGKGKSGPVVAKVAPVSAVRWAGHNEVGISALASFFVSGYFLAP